MEREWERRAQAALDRAEGCATVLVDESFTVRWVSASWVRIFGYDAAGTRGLDLLHPDDVHFALSMLVHHHDHAELYGDRGGDSEIVSPSSEMRVRHADGRFLKCLARIDNQLADPDVGALVVHVQRTSDPSALPRAIDRIATGNPVEDALLATLSFMADDSVRHHRGPMAVAWYDGDGHRHVTTHAPSHIAAAMFSPDVSALPKGPRALTVTHTADLPPGEVRDCAERLGMVCLWTVEVGDPGNHLGHVLAWSAYEFTADVRPFTHFSIGCDIVRLALHERRRREVMRLHAITDPLTGVYNRTGLNEAFVRLAATEPAVGALFIDIDDFKQVNDAWGHAIGDQVLAEIAARLDRVCRTSDVVARMGGDEFVLLCASVEPAALSAIIRRVEDAFVEPVLSDAGPVKVGATVGFSTAARGGGLQDLLRDADEALYAMKRQAKSTLR